MTEINQLIDFLNRELRSQADPTYRELVRNRYNMNVDNFWGVRTPIIHRIAGSSYKMIKTLTIDERLTMCQKMLKMKIYEHKIIAFRWAYLARKEHSQEHLSLFSAWLSEFVDDWIDCDDLCIHVIGEFFLRYPDLAKEVLGWVDSANVWVRRGAAVSLILPARKGQQLQLVFQTTDFLLDDKEVLVQKAYGWLLKVASKTYPEEILAFLLVRRDKMPRIAFRYALEKLPQHMREKAMMR